jgi:hypothetical protein
MFIVYRKTFVVINYRTTQKINGHKLLQFNKINGLLFPKINVASAMTVVVHKNNGSIRRLLG